MWLKQDRSPGHCWRNYWAGYNSDSLWWLLWEEVHSILLTCKLYCNLALLYHWGLGYKGSEESHCERAPNYVYKTYWKSELFNQYTWKEQKVFFCLLIKTTFHPLNTLCKFCNNNDNNKIHVHYQEESPKQTCFFVHCLQDLNRKKLFPKYSRSFQHFGQKSISFCFSPNVQDNESAHICFLQIPWDLSKPDQQIWK